MTARHHGGVLRALSQCCVPGDNARPADMAWERWLAEV